MLLVVRLQLPLGVRPADWKPACSTKQHQEGTNDPSAPDSEIRTGELK